MSNAQPMGARMTAGGVRVERAAEGLKAALNDRVWRAKTNFGPTTPRWLAVTE